MAEFRVAQSELPDLANPFTLSTGSHTIVVTIEAEPTSFFEILLIDEFGEPLDQPVELVITIDGTENTIATGSDGKAKIENTAGVQNAELSFSDKSISDLQSALNPRWSQIPRIKGNESNIIKKSEDTSVVYLRTALKDQRITLNCDAPQKISVQQSVVMARMKGLYFDTMKCFLLPQAIKPLQLINDIYKDNPDSKLLIVGHTDTSGKRSYNDQLSIDRAESVAAYLTDTVDSWLAWYDDGIDEDKRWGKHENNLMLDTVLTGQNLTKNADKVKEFQKWHNTQLQNEESTDEPLAEDGDLGPKTLQALIMRYMKQDNTSLPEGIEPVVHGCGEYFPLDETEKELDQNAKDSQHDQGDRRVELFFFNNPIGILPQPSGTNSSKDSTEYPEWRSRSRKIEVGDGQDILTIKFLDAKGNPMPPGTPYRVTIGNAVREGTLEDTESVDFTGIFLEDEDTALVEWSESSEWTYSNPKADS